MTIPLCNSKLVFDIGACEKACIFYCQLPDQHSGPHGTTGDMYGTIYQVIWENSVWEDAMMNIQDNRDRNEIEGMRKRVEALNNRIAHLLSESKTCDLNTESGLARRAEITHELSGLGASLSEALDELESVIQRYM